MDACVILNPQAGSADDPNQITSRLHRLGDVVVHTTRRPGDAQKLARQAVAEGCPLVVAAGGDGTLNEVVNGLAPDFGARLGILPLGTGNDFVRTMPMPDDLDQAIDVLRAGHTQRIDVVRVRSDAERYFINVSAAGFTGLMDEKLTPDLKRAWGPLAYLRGAAEALPDLTNYHTRLTFDDHPPVELEAYNIIVANARFAGGGIPVAPEAQLDDGLLDVIIVPAASMPQLAVLVPQILLGQHLSNELLLFRRARKLAINSKPGMWFNVDGELVGNEPARFDVLPRALEVVTAINT